MSSEQVFFKGTKFETKIDVGQCKGKCRSRGKWQPGLRFYECDLFNAVWIVIVPRVVQPIKHYNHYECLKIRFSNNCFVCLQVLVK